MPKSHFLKILAEGRDFGLFLYISNSGDLGLIFIFFIKKIMAETRDSGYFLIKFGPKSCISALFYCPKSYVSKHDFGLFLFI